MAMRPTSIDVERLLQHVCAELAGLGRRVVGRRDRDVAVPVRRLVGGEQRRGRAAVARGHRVHLPIADRVVFERPPEDVAVEGLRGVGVAGRQLGPGEGSGGIARTFSHTRDATPQEMNLRNATTVAALIVLAVTWGSKPPTLVLIIVGVLLAAAVLAAVHHAEVVAHRVGEPFGSLVLAVAVTVIEVGADRHADGLRRRGHRDARPRHGVRRGDDHLQRHRRAVACCSARCSIGVASLQRRGHRRPRWPPWPRWPRSCLVLPTFTTSAPGPEFSGRAARVRGVASLALYGLFVFVQTVRHRDYFLPVTTRRTPRSTHAGRPATATALDQPRRCWSSRWSPSSGWPRSSRRRSRTASTRARRARSRPSAS